MANNAELTNLLNPENLTTQSIISILQQRMVVIDDVDNITKDSLVDLFHRTVTPQPQRVMRNNRVGKFLKCQQEKVNLLKPKSMETPNLLTFCKKVSPKLTCSQKSGIVMSTNISSSTGYRLKPPPIVINKKNCIVKLNPPIESKKDSVNGKIIKLIKSPSSIASSRPKEKNLPVKRPSQETKQNSDSDNSPKKKLKKITWP